MNEDLHAEAESVLAAAVTAFADVPGVDAGDEGDVVRSMASGRPWPFLNAIARVRLSDGAVETRVGELEEPYVRAGLPVIWSMTDRTRPTDLDDVLDRLGHSKGDWDATMMIELDPWPSTAQHALDAATASGLTLSVVETRPLLDEWIEVMADSYGWADRRRAQAMREVYDPEAPHGRTGKRTHLLARLGGQAVGSSSLFETAGQGWITNVGVIPRARGREFGAAITSAVMEMALERGFARAWLGASEMGAPLYRRLGFSTEGLMSHRLRPVPR